MAIGVVGLVFKDIGVDGDFGRVILDILTCCGVLGRLIGVLCRCKGCAGVLGRLGTLGVCGRLETDFGVCGRLIVGTCEV